MVRDSFNKPVEYQQVLYVFTVLSNVAKKNSKHNKQKSRAAGCGCWHVHSSAKPVMDSCGRKIGESKNFTFKSQEQTVGQWTMTEYSIDAAANGLPELGESDYVLCRIKKDESKSSKDGRIVGRKRKTEDVLPEVGQNFPKKMKSVSGNEGLNELTGTCNSSWDCDNGAPLLMNMGDSDSDTVAAAVPSTCWSNPVRDDEAFWLSSNFQSFDIGSYLKELEAF